MGKISDKKLELREVVNVAAVIAAGGLSVFFVFLVLDDIGLLFSREIKLILSGTAGIVLGLLPWGFKLSSGPTRIILLYYAATFLGSVGLAGTVSIQYPLITIGIAVVIFGATTVYKQSTAPDHSILVMTWIAVLFVYTIGLLGMGRALIMTRDLFQTLVPLAATLFIIVTHQAFIRERKRQI